MKRAFPYMLLGLVVVAIWAETFVSSKLLLTAGLMPADIFTYRFLMGYVGMICLSHKRLMANNWRDEMLLLLGGITGGSVYFLVENMAIKFSTASNIAILIGTTPLITALLMACFYRDERLSGRQIVGSLIAFVGLVLVVLNGQMVLHLNPHGDILALLAAALWSVYSLIMKVLSPRYDTLFITRKVFGYGLLTILPWFLFVHPLNLDPALLSQPVVWGNLLWLGIVASLICYMAWNWLLPRMGVVRSTNILYTQSSFTMCIAAIVLGEHITWMAILGTAIMISGMLLLRSK